MTAAATEPITTPAPTASAAQPSPLRMSYEAYLAWEHEGGLAEWVDGEVILHMSASIVHQRVVDFLNRVLGLFVSITGAGVVLSAPAAMRAIPGGNAREPDLFFLATEHLTRLTESALEGPADLVVEVISDDSVMRDRDTKFHEYERGGIREYWLLDPRPNRQRADFYVRDERGRYQPVPLGLDDIYRSTVLPAFWLNTAWLWAEQPDPLRALAQIVGTERLLAALTA
ncbi:MAG: Uma2 family endonuclease [Chloroflexaceae bacterium]|nr:Uma2 family endonuclease [Chloroflexaceae bacterium]